MNLSGLGYTREECTMMLYPQLWECHLECAALSLKVFITQISQSLESSKTVRTLRDVLFSCMHLDLTFLEQSCVHFMKPRTFLDTGGLPGDTSRT